ncbi:MAG TPA: hypothetical protein VFI33_12635, partial [Puia sp.]|nr:hypothetical protein [Puia sp.]
MQTFKCLILFLPFCIQSDVLQKTNPLITTKEVIYHSGDKTCKGYIAYDENIKGKRPVIIIVHEWWGLNDY